MNTLVRLVLPILVLLTTGLLCIPDNSAAAELRLATFHSDVTLPIGHWLYRQPLKTVEHPLTAKGVVIDDGNMRCVLVAVDWCTLRNSSHELFCRKVAAAAGTDTSHVVIHCVHVHTAPSVDGEAQRLLNQTENPPQRIDLEFLEQVTDRLAAAVKASLEHMEPFNQVGIGEATVERVASNRRIPIGNGKVRTRYSSCKDPELRAAPEGKIDPILKTITLARDGKPLVRLHYYATHPQSYYGDGRASIDTAGMARQRLEQLEGVFQIYFTGCAGDVAMGKYNDGSPEARKQLTERLFTGMQAAANHTKLLPLERIGWRTVPVKFEARTDDGYDPVKNRATLLDPKASDDQRARAASRLACARRLQQPIPLSCLELGPVRIVHLPGEPMVEFQLFAQQLLPDCFVAVAGYGLGTPGYICTEVAFDEGGYEPTASAVVPASEHVFKKAIRQLLTARQ